MPRDLEWDVIKIPLCVMVRCANTFVHKVYISMTESRLQILF